jgi:mono/diheme cytochrome c family protein
MKGAWTLAICGLLLGATLGGAGRAVGQEGDSGKTLFDSNCVICHGKGGEGSGPGAIAFNPKPANFTDPKFWKNMNDEKIADTIKHGKGMMPPFNFSSEQIMAIIKYIKHFKK